MILAGIAWLCLAPVFLISMVFAVEAGFGLWPLRWRGTPAEAPRIAVIVPAHDEEAGIAATVAALRADLPSGSRLLVVADNCSDATAMRATEAGAEVIERHDRHARGKGHALARGRDHLTADPPDVAIVIDADCRISPDGIRLLAEATAIARAPIQACYLMTQPTDAAPMVELSGFAFLVKNLVRQRGLARIGAPAILTGSGMAFPWAIFAEAPLATDDIVEDLGLGIACARGGCSPQFREDIVVRSAPSSGAGTIEQRRRWEHGFLATARRMAPPLLRSGRWGLTWLGLHLLVPPLALLMLVNLALLAVLAGLWAIGGTGAPLCVQAATLAVLTLIVGLAWRIEGRDQIRAGALLKIPLYMLWKLPIYLSALTRRERRWVRTKRD